MLRILFFLGLIHTLGFAQQKPELVVQLGHSSTIRQIDISRDGKYMVSTSADQTIKIWENKTNKLLKTVFLEREAYTVAFDSNNLVWVGMEKKMLIYDLKGDLKHSLPSHKDAPNAMDLSPDGKTMASGGWDKKIILWDVEQKTQITTLEGHNSEVKSLFFSNDGSKLLSCESYGKKEEGIIKNIFVWDLKTMQAKKIRGGELLPSWAAWSADNSKILYIAGGVWQAGAYGCIEVATEKTLYEKNAPEGLHWISQHKSADYFLLGGASYASVGGQDKVKAILYQIKLSDGSVVSSDNTFTDGIIWCVKYSADQSIAAFTVGHQIKVMDAKSLKIVRELKTLGEPYWNISRSKNDKIVSSSAVYWDKYSNSTKVWDFSKGRIDKAIEKYTDEINNSLIDSKGVFMASATRGGLMRIVSVDGGDMDAYLRLKGADNLKDVAIHPSNTFVLGVSKNGGFLGIDLVEGNYQLKAIEKASYTAVEFDKDGKFFVAGLGNGKTEIWMIDPKKPLDMNKYSLSSTIDAITETSGGLSMTGSVADVKISPDGNTLAIGSFTNIKIVDLVTMQTKATLKAESGVTGITFSDDGRYLACGARYKINVFDLTTKKLVASLSGHQNDVMGVCFSKNGKYLYSGSLDTQIKIWDWRENRELLSATSIAGTQEYILYTPEGYYLASKGGTKVLTFKVGDRNYPFEQFDLKYNRPDKVLKVLTEIEYGKMQGSPNEFLIEAYTKAYNKRIKKLNFSEEHLATEFHLPEVKISQNLPAYTKKADISFEIKATDTKYNLNRLYVSVNGVPLEGAKGRFLGNKKPSFSEKMQINLSKGRNLVEVSVMNEKGVESLKEQFEINYDAPLGAKRSIIHLVTVGVSEYQNNQMNLRYASKDGKDLASLFQVAPMLKNTATEGALQVVHHALFDKEATKENVLKLKKELSKTGVDDMVIVFVSGHGLLDKNLDYFIATHNVDFGNPSEKGLAYEDLENLLDGIPARQKILLMDACHSGEIDKEEVQLVASNNTIKKAGLKFKNFGDQTVQNKNVGLQNSFELSKQLFTDLRKGSGTTVLSAASGVQLAQESTDWQNGAFTYCLLNGLKNMKADLNGDGKVMLSELQKYLFEEVPRLTGGVQQPTSRIENLTHDFRIW